jgi:hypothetical protein
MGMTCNHDGGGKVCRSEGSLIYYIHDSIDLTVVLDGTWNYMTHACNRINVFIM